MSKALVSMTLSLDGFIAGPNRGPTNSLGGEGPTLHTWAFAGPPLLGSK